MLRFLASLLCVCSNIFHLLYCVVVLYKCSYSRFCNVFLSVKICFYYHLAEMIFVYETSVRAYYVISGYVFINCHVIFKEFLYTCITVVRFGVYVSLL